MAWCADSVRPSEPLAGRGADRDSAAQVQGQQRNRYRNGFTYLVAIGLSSGSRMSTAYVGHLDIPAPSLTSSLRLKRPEIDVGPPQAPQGSSAKTWSPVAPVGCLAIRLGGRGGEFPREG